MKNWKSFFSKIAYNVPEVINIWDQDELCKYISSTSFCDISFVDSRRSPTTRDKVIHTPPPEYRGTYRSGEKSPSASQKEIIIWRNDYKNF